MSTEKLSLRRGLLETIEKSWRVPNGCPKNVSEEVASIIAEGLGELREALARPGTSVALLPLPEAGHPVKGDSSTPAYTAEQMAAYALANVETRVVAWHFHRDPTVKGMFGLNWPEVSRIIREEKKAINAAGTITETEPGTLTAMVIDDVLSFLSKTLIKVSRLESAVEATERKNAELAQMVQIMTPERDLYKASSEALEDQWNQSSRELAKLESRFNQQSDILAAVRLELEGNAKPGWQDRCITMLDELVASSAESTGQRAQSVGQDKYPASFDGAPALPEEKAPYRLMPPPDDKAPEGAFKAWLEQTHPIAIVESGRSFSDQHKALLAQVERLKDPEVVLVNMLQGSIAKPNVRTISKLYGEVLNDEDARLLEIVKLRAYTGELETLLNHWVQLSNVCDDTQAELTVETASLLSLKMNPEKLEHASNGSSQNE